MHFEIKIHFLKSDNILKVQVLMTLHFYLIFLSCQQLKTFYRVFPHFYPAHILCTSSVLLDQQRQKSWEAKGDKAETAFPEAKVDSSSCHVAIIAKFSGYHTHAPCPVPTTPASLSCAQFKQLSSETTLTHKHPQ